MATTPLTPLQALAQDREAVRTSDIDAACGQLRLKTEKERELASTS